MYHPSESNSFHNQYHLSRYRIISSTLIINMPIFNLHPLPLTAHHTRIRCYNFRELVAHAALSTLSHRTFTLTILKFTSLTSHCSPLTTRPYLASTLGCLGLMQRCLLHPTLTHTHHFYTHHSPLTTRAYITSPLGCSWLL
jgi:hypothetical protein